MSTSSAPSDFAARLSDALKSRAISRKEFAGIVGVSRNTVTSWTRGRYRPDHEHCGRIATALGMSIDELFGRATPPRRNGEPASPLKHTAASADHEAQRIVRALAVLELEEPLEGLQRITPSILRVLADARAHARTGNGTAR
jgi:transcriptional regulator with XRE-family HTH domain